MKSQTPGPNAQSRCSRRSTFQFHTQPFTPPQVSSISDLSVTVHTSSHITPLTSSQRVIDRRPAPSTPLHHSRPHPSLIALAHCPRPLIALAHCPRASLPSSLDLASASFSAALDAAQTPANQRELKSFRTYIMRKPPYSPLCLVSSKCRKQNRCPSTE